ncbi:MAG: hypothetical protein C0622_03440 [Desulfuromonas sp.]|nr:MAG: hypothetical protein C0622_03440 [Desulfuromonas sp.]
MKKPIFSAIILATVVGLPLANPVAATDISATPPAATAPQLQTDESRTDSLATADDKKSVIMPVEEPREPEKTSNRSDSPRVTISGELRIMTIYSHRHGL